MSKKKKVELRTEMGEDPQGFPRRHEELYIDGEVVFMPARREDIAWVTAYILEHLGYEVDVSETDETTEQ